MDNMVLVENLKAFFNCQDQSPKWLKTTRKLSDLPRFLPKYKDVNQVEEIDLFGLNEADFINRIVWIIDNLANEWWLNEDRRKIYLTSERDRVHYYMMWVEI